LIKVGKKEKDIYYDDISKKTTELSFYVLKDEIL
jgi:hypothetical protein